MTITLITKSKKEVTQVYLRLKDTTHKIDTMCGTGISVVKSEFKDGEIKSVNSKNFSSAILKAEVNQKNKEIDNQNKKLGDFKKDVIFAYNNRNDYDVINSKWLKKVLFDDDNRDRTPNELIKYFDYYISERENEISVASVKKLKNVRNRFSEYISAKNKNILIQQLDNQFRADFKKWFINNEGYHFNTFKKQIKVLVTVCNYATSVTKKALHPDTSKLNTGDSMRTKETDYIALSFKELKQIEQTELKIKELDVTRDWLLICCYTAQRISDFLNYSASDIVVLDDNNKYLDITQAKTGKQVYIPLNDVVLSILEKYNGNFPPLYSTSKALNEQTFNALVKRVGSKCGINEIIESYKKVDNRLKLIKEEKYNFITGHSGRRSFATNYFGIIPTALIIAITAHSSEQNLKFYIKAKPENLAKSFTKKLNEIKDL